MNQSLFKMEAKFDIKLYHSEIDTLNLNHWLQPNWKFILVSIRSRRGKNLIHGDEIRGPCTELVGDPHRNLDVGGRTSSEYMGGYKNLH